MDFEHRFTLDPGSKKIACPSCDKRRFVRYIDRETGEYHPNPVYGRCDSQNSCGYINTVPLGKKAYRVDYLLLQTITDKAMKLTDKRYGIHIIPKSVVLEKGADHVFIAEWYLHSSNLIKVGRPKFFGNNEGVVNTLIERPKVKELPPSYHTNDLMKKGVPENLSVWLTKRFGMDAVRQAAWNYNLTGIDTPWSGSTVFWQVDETGNIRGGKVLNYNPISGKRVKDPKPRITWMHSLLKLESFNLTQCLYGLHLVKKRPKATVCVVESEKTAIYMSMVRPEYIWVSCGSVNGLKAKLLEPLKGRRVVAFPDKGCKDQWEARAVDLRNEGHKIKVSRGLEDTDLKEGADVADYLETKKEKQKKT